MRACTGKLKPGRWHCRRAQEGELDPSILDLGDLELWDVCPPALLSPPPRIVSGSVVTSTSAREQQGGGAGEREGEAKEWERGRALNLGIGKGEDVGACEICICRDYPSAAGPRCCRFEGIHR